MTLALEDAARVMRASTVQQVTGELIDSNGCRCAMGVLGGEDLGLEHMMVTRIERDGRRCHETHSEVVPMFQKSAFKIAERIGGCYGMSQRMVSQIIEWNDGIELTFGEIADRIDEWANGDLSNIEVASFVAQSLTVVP